MTESVERVTGHFAVWIVQTSSMSIKAETLLENKKIKPFWNRWFR